MSLFKYYCLLAAISLLSLSIPHARAQNVGIGSATPNTVLEVNGDFSTRSFATAAANAITVPAASQKTSVIRITAVGGTQTNAITSLTGYDGKWLVIRNEDNDAATYAGITIPANQTYPFMYLNGAWRYMGVPPGGSGWALTGNATTVDGTNFLGTTDDVPMNIRVNNIHTARFETNGRMALGLNSSSTGTEAIAIGRAATASGDYSVLLAPRDQSNVAGSVANQYGIGIGARATVSGDYGIAIGGRNPSGIPTRATAAAAVSLGSGTQASGNSSVAIGAYNSTNLSTTASGEYSVAIGATSTASGVRSIAMGGPNPSNTSSTASSDYSLALGAGATASNQYTVAIGGPNAATNVSARATAIYGVAIGAGALASGDRSIAIGAQNDATNQSPTSSGTFSVAIGAGSTASGTRAIAIGARHPATNNSPNASGNDAFAVGAGSVANTGSIAIGYAASANVTNAVVLGYGSSGTANNTTAVGYGSSATGNNATAVGYVSLAALDNSVAVGHGSISGNNSTAVGYVSTAASDNSVAMGYNSSTTANNAVAIGNGSRANYDNSTALGNGATAPSANSVRLGNTAITTIAGQVALSVTSDQRVKQNIQANVPGLDFVLKLRPVTYDMNPEALVNLMSPAYAKANPKLLEETRAAWQGQLQTGFLAQEVEAAAASLGYNFNGVDTPAEPGQLYGLRYAVFTVPLVKAVQELNTEVEALKAQNAALLRRLEALEAASR